MSFVIRWSLILELTGYGLMIKLRGTNNSDAELFIVQAVQGIGSGTIQMICLTIAQIVVPHAELAQVSALVLLAVFLGSGVGSSVAGGIYTNYFKSALYKHMGDNTSASVVDSIYNSIVSSDLPSWGTTERIAANAAVSPNIDTERASITNTISTLMLCATSASPPWLSRPRS